MLSLALLALIGVLLLCLYLGVRLLWLMESIDRGGKHWRAGTESSRYAQGEIETYVGAHRRKTQKFLCRR